MELRDAKEGGEEETVGRGAETGRAERAVCELPVLSRFRTRAALLRDALAGRGSRFASLGFQLCGR